MGNRDADDWPEGWGALDAAAAAFFTAQLAREIGPEHPVSAEIAAGRMRAVGKFWGSDDVVFAMERGPAPFVLVHLAFPEPDTRGWLARKLRPRPASRYLPALVPVARIADLARYCG